jgi:transposase
VVAERSALEESAHERRFGTTGSALRELRAWLLAERVSEVAMESTAQYWKPVWMELEGQFHLYLAQARSTAAPRGRKTDSADALRIVKRLVADDLTLSYVPEAEQRRWRLLARARTQLVQDRVRIRNQMEGVLEEARIKLSSFVSDLLGWSSRKMLRALANGVEDPDRLAELGAPWLQASREDLREALSGHLHALHRKLLGMQLNRVEALDRDIEILEQELSAALRSHQAAIERLCEVPGIRATAAQQILAEVGCRAEAFPSPAQLASWIGCCPGREESAGRSRQDRSPTGNRAMRRLLTQIAWGAVHTNGSFFQHLFRRLLPRLGIQKAIWAVAHRITRLLWRILHEGVSYRECGDTPTDPKTIQRRKQRILRQLRKLGFSAVLTPYAPAT